MITSYTVLKQFRCLKKLLKCLFSSNLEHVIILKAKKNFLKSKVGIVLYSKNFFPDFRKYGRLVVDKQTTCLPNWWPSETFTVNTDRVINRNHQWQGKHAHFWGIRNGKIWLGRVPTFPHLNCICWYVTCLLIYKTHVTVQPKAAVVKLVL